MLLGVRYAKQYHSMHAVTLYYNILKKRQVPARRACSVTPHRRAYFAMPRHMLDICPAVQGPQLLRPRGDLQIMDQASDKGYLPILNASLSTGWSSGSCLSMGVVVSGQVPGLCAQTHHFIGVNSIG